MLAGMNLDIAYSKTGASGLLSQRVETYRNLQFRIDIGPDEDDSRIGVGWKQPKRRFLSEMESTPAEHGLPADSLLGHRSQLSPSLAETLEMTSTVMSSSGFAQTLT